MKCLKHKQKADIIFSHMGRGKTTDNGGDYHCPKCEELEEWDSLRMRAKNAPMNETGENLK
jgi:hypothetical protein